MVEVTHDWDEEDYVRSLDIAFEEYRMACYGAFNLPPTQLRETRQAFLSGIHWLANRSDYCPDDLEAALRQILGEHNPFIKSA